MNYQEAIKKMETLKTQGKVVVDLTFRGTVAVPFVKEEVSEYVSSDFDFHWLGSSILDYQKNFVLALGEMAGAELADLKSQKLSRFAFTSTAFLERKLPSGSKETVTADYEFDAETRYDIEEANRIIKGDGPKYQDPAKQSALRIKRISEMATVGRGRADTGSHKRAIVKMLRLPSAQHKSNGKYTFLGAHFFVSKVVPNLENSQIQGMYFQSLLGIAGRAYGPQMLIDEHEPDPVEFSQVVEQEDDSISVDFTPVTEEGIKTEQSLLLPWIEAYRDIEESRVILEWSGTQDVSIQKAVSHLFASAENDEGDKRLAKAVATLRAYMYHPRIIEYKIPGGQSLLDYLEGCIASGSTKEIWKSVQECCKLTKTGGNQ